MHRLGVVKREVTSAISKSHGLSVADLVLVSPGSIPITTSGKVRRGECVEQVSARSVRPLRRLVSPRVLTRPNSDSASSTTRTTNRLPDTRRSNRPSRSGQLRCAHSVGHQQDPGHGDDDGKDPPTVSPHSAAMSPPAERSQCWPHARRPATPSAPEPPPARGRSMIPSTLSVSPDHITPGSRGESHPRPPQIRT